MTKFDLEKYCKIVQDHSKELVPIILFPLMPLLFQKILTPYLLEITFAYAVPPVILLLAKHPVVSKYDLSSLRMVSLSLYTLLNPYRASASR